MLTPLSSVVVQLADAIGAAESLRDVYEAALAGLRDVTGIERASILLFDSDGVMRFKASAGLSDDMAWDAFAIVIALLPAMQVLTAALVAVKNRGVRSPRMISVGTPIVGSTARTSAWLFMLVSAAAAAGLALERR